MLSMPAEILLPITILVAILGLLYLKSRGVIPSDGSGTLAESIRKKIIEDQESKRPKP
jgi:hypothetical protein